jgi:hypothetical protein
MPNPENITKHQFKKGQSGNPKGKPVGTVSFKNSIKKFGAMVFKGINPETNQEEEMTLVDVITSKQYQKALRGDSKSFELLKNHIESLPKQGIDLSNTDGTLSKEIVFKRYKKEK